MPKLTIQKIFNHWKTVHTHRKWVRKYCFMAGLYWRGLTHDLSKYSPVEFLESAKYWTGTHSPIDEAKKDKGYSRAWLHHRGRNPHHWAYWADNFSEGLTVYCMPMNDFVEMVCDFLAAGRAYSGKNFTYEKERLWWKHEREYGCAAMNERNKIMLDIIFSDLAAAEQPEKNGLKLDWIKSPEQLIKERYIQSIYKANIYKKNYIEDTWNYKE